MEIALALRNFRSRLEREAMDRIGDIRVTRRAAKDTRYRAKRAALPLVGGLIALLLAACETSSSNTTDATVSSLTTPQQATVQAKPVAFAPVIGAPAKVSSKMNERLVAAAGQKNLAVA